MKKHSSKIEKLLIIKGGILALELAFIFCFFIGIFWNPPIATEVYDQNHRFYINRGYPIAWAGTSATDKNVELPYIKAPLLTQKLSIDGSEWNKVIDLKIFTPLFISAFLVFYLLSFPFAKASDENKSLNMVLIPSYVVLALLCIFVYFFWFPRV